MADQVTATAAPSRPAHEEGQFAAVCVDVIDLGQRVEQYQDQPARVVPKCVLLFVTNTEGETKDISVEVTVSMDKKAKLRQLLEKWRGKSYTPEQASAGVPLHKLVGQSALLTVEHKTSRNDRIYANILSLTPLPKEMSAPSANGYKRADFWADRKKQYADETAKYLQSQSMARNEPPAEEQYPDEDESLPF